MSLPTREEISPSNCENLDEKKAVSHLLGRSVADYVRMLEDNSLYYQEDLMWIGPVAFDYYFRGMTEYLRSAISRGDQDVVEAWTRILEFRIEHGELFSSNVLADVRASVEYCKDNYDKFRPIVGADALLWKLNRLSEKLARGRAGE